MKFDHTFIAIRQRTALEIYDLALHVLRDYFGPIMLLLLVGALPWMLFDWFLIGWMLSDEYCDSYTVSLLGLMVNDTSYDHYAVGYAWMIMIMICTQAHVGTAMISHYLGQSMFIGNPKVTDSIKSIWRVPITYYWLHYGLRGVLPVALFAWVMKGATNDEDMYIFAGFWLLMTAFVGIIVRACRPFVTKIIVLEKAPWKATEDNPIAFSKRSTALHGSGGGNLLGMFTLSILIGFPLTIGIYGFLHTLYSALDLSWSIGFVELAVVWPISIWLVAGFFAIVRFLAYIDVRIRQEGWEVELRIRSEALKLEQSSS